jgi:hypothetical protein
MHTGVRSLCPLWHCRWSRPFPHALPLTRCLRRRCNYPVSLVRLRAVNFAPPTQPSVPLCSLVPPSLSLTPPAECTSMLPPAAFIFPHISASSCTFRASVLVSLARVCLVFPSFFVPLFHLAPPCITMYIYFRVPYFLSTTSYFLPQVLPWLSLPIPAPAAPVMNTVGACVIFVLLIIAAFCSVLESHLDPFCVGIQPYQVQRFSSMAFLPRSL